MSSNEGDRLLTPVVGLRIPRPWIVGPVTFHPGDTAAELVSKSMATGHDDPNVVDVFDGAGSGAIAEVMLLTDAGDAIEQVRGALDAIRLFDCSRRTWFTGTSFGLPGDLYQSKIRYVRVGRQASVGWLFRGDAEGLTFDEDALTAWETSSAFGFLADAVAQPEADDASQRAAVGARLFSRAALEHRPDLKLLGLTSALEAWTMRRSPGAQTMRLARHVSWFGCGRAHSDLCARDRPVCPYLHLSPDIAKDRRRLSTLRQLGNTHSAWRCSEWHRVVDWYEERSGTAHGDPSALSVEHVLLCHTHVRILVE